MPACDGPKPGIEREGKEKETSHVSFSAKALSWPHLPLRVYSSEVLLDTSQTLLDGVHTASDALKHCLRRSHLRDSESWRAGAVFPEIEKTPFMSCKSQVWLQGGYVHMAVWSTTVCVASKNLGILR